MRTALLALLIACPVMAQDTPQTRMRLIGPENPPITATEGERQPHHDAVVRVSTPSGSGSGVMISVDGVEGAVFLTNHHVVTPHRTMTLISSRTNNRIPAVLWGADANLDLAVCYAATAHDHTTLPLANIIPQPGTQLELVGAGALQPNVGLRTRTGPVIRADRSSMYVDTYSYSGDSGGPYIYDGKAVFAIHAGGSRWVQGFRDSHGNWSKSVPGRSAAVGTSMTQYVQRICGPNGCQPQIWGGDGQIVRPTPTQPIQPRPTDPTAPGGCCGKDGKDGIDGKDGPPGPAGAQGVPGKDAEFTPEEREELRLSILADLRSYIADNPDFKGPPGDSGIDPVELAARIQPHLDPIRAQWVDENKKVLRDKNGIAQQSTAYLGGVLQLRLTEETENVGD